MTKLFSFFKEPSARIIFLIFAANVCYDDPTLYLYKRILYSLFIYWAIWEIGNFYYQTRINDDAFKMPVFYNVYIPLLFLSVIISLGKDLTGSHINWITLLNNPFALLSVFPIFLFVVGVNTDDIEPVFGILKTAIVVFLVVVLLPVFGKIKYYQGYICCQAFVPFFLISSAQRKYKVLSWLLLLIGIVFSNVSESRTVALRILAFLALYIGFSMFKKIGFLKFIIVIFSCFCLYEFVTNLADILHVFKDFIGVKSFDDDDTRAFLWKEVIGDTSGWEYIFGKGFLGTYFSEYFLMMLVEYNTLADHYDRFTVEVGFLELLLKGGFFWYIIYIIPILYSSMKGIFYYYEDKMVFFISTFLFTELLLMYIENIPYFSFQFSLIFFLAGFSIRQMRKNDEYEEMECNNQMSQYVN